MDFSQSNSRWCAFSRVLITAGNLSAVIQWPMLEELDESASCSNKILVWISRRMTLSLGVLGRQVLLVMDNKTSNLGGPVNFTYQLSNKTSRAHLNIWIHYRTSPSRMTFASNNTRERVFSNCCFKCHFFRFKHLFSHISKGKIQSSLEKRCSIGNSEDSSIETAGFLVAVRTGSIGDSKNRCA